METVDKCPLCGSQSHSVLMEQTFEDKYLSLIDESLNKTTRHWIKCDDCGLIMHNPRTTREEEKVLYDRFRDEDFRGETADEYFDRLTSLPADQSECAKRARWIAETFPEKDFPCIVDVGCGGGILLNYVKQYYPDSDIIGIEPNLAYGKVAEERLGIRMIYDLYLPGLLDKPADLVLCTDVFEHIADINPLWETVQADMQPGAVLFVEVPSVRNFGNAPEDHDFFLSQHIYFFEVKHLEQIAQKHGFRLHRHIPYEADRGATVYKDILLFVRQ